MIYIIWPEGDLSKAQYAKSRVGAEFQSILMGLRLLASFRPTRVCIGFTDT